MSDDDLKTWAGQIKKKAHGEAAAIRFETRLRAAAPDMLQLLQKLIAIAPNEGASALALLGLEAQVLLGRIES